MILKDMPNAEYHAGTDAISSSGLKLLARSPAHYWATYLDPQREPTAPTPAMLMGTMIHTAVLEPHRFDDEYIAIPEGLDKRTKEGKALWQEIAASGRQPITEAQRARAIAVASSLLAHPAARVIFSADGEAESSIFWTDAATGARCKARPDFMVRPCQQWPNGLVVDLKTTGDAGAEAFMRTAFNLGYHISAAHYTAGFVAEFGVVPAFIFAAVEQDAPHAAAFYAAGEDFMLLGERERCRLTELYATCRAADSWPGYPETVGVLGLPAWAAKQLENA